MNKTYKPRLSVKILAIFVVLIIALLLYGRYLNPTGLIVYEKAIYNEILPKNYNGLKIAHFSDLHYGRTTTKENLDKVVNELNNLNADIVIFTGDLFDNKENDDKTIKLITNSFKNIKAKLFKFAIIGDYDEQYLDTYKNILKNSDFILLDNEVKKVYYHNATPINIIGLSNTNNYDKLYNAKEFNITLIHKPDLVANINKSNLTFAGHSLGGQIKIPFLDGIKKIEGASTYINSYYKVNNNDLYISNGIGTQDISLRLFNKPSITLYRLYNS